MMSIQESSSKKKKKKLKPIPVLILIVTLFAIVVSLLLVFRTKPEEESVTISISGVGEATKNSDINETNSVQETKVSIDMDSCAIPIGTILKVTASIDPAVEVEKSINWSSSDQSVFTVDSEGIITIKGKGTSALTATIGNSSDAIVIEGIANENAAKSQNNLPIFNLISGGTNLGNETSGNETSGNGTSGNGSSSNGSSSNGSSGNGSAGNVVSDNGTSGNGSSSNDSSGTNTNINNSSNTEKTTDSQKNESNSGLKSTDLYQSLSEIGYTQLMSNVYVYEENNTYYGEIIIQSNVTIIYIKQRCDGFDTKIKEVIAKLIPTENSEVWNNYISSSSDRTFTVEGRTVRIVTALNGGHSQIVIYN